MKKNKLSKVLFLLITIMSVVFVTTKVKAQEYVGDFVYGDNTETKVYINKMEKIIYDCTKKYRKDCLLFRANGRYSRR